MIKRLFFTGVIALTAAMYPLSAHALCSQRGTIVDISFDTSLSSFSTHVIRITTGSLRDHYYFVVTTVDAEVNNATVMMTSQKSVEVVGDATSCPLSGTTRDMGTLVAIRGL